MYIRMYHILPWYITDVPPLLLEQIFTPFQKQDFTINNSGMQLFIAVIAKYFMDLLCIFYYSAYRRLLFLANSFVVGSTEFATVHALMLQFNYYTTLFNVQRCSVDEHLISQTKLW